MTNPQKFIISTEVLKPALKKLVPCMSKEDTRYYLCSVLLKFDGQELMLVATDGIKLGRILMNMEEADQGDVSLDQLTPFEVIIPAESVHILIKSLPKESRTIVTVMSDKVMFDWKFASYETNIIDATYPDFDNVRAQKTEDGITICFNANYLKKLSGSIDGYIRIHLNKDTALPVLIEDTDREGVEFTLMPVRA